MSESERVQIGITLEVVRDSLRDFVDQALTAAYGPDWDDLAEDDARRKSRKWPVTKTDVTVMLKVLVHRRVEPWGSSPFDRPVPSQCRTSVSLGELVEKGESYVCQLV